MRDSTVVLDYRIPVDEFEVAIVRGAQAEEQAVARLDRVKSSANGRFVGAALIAALICAAIAGCGGGGGDSSGTGGLPASEVPPAPPAAPAPVATRVTETLVVGGRERRFTLNLPPAWSAQSDRVFPLVVALHGGGGSGEQFEQTNGLTPKADAAGFAVVYPDGSAPGPLGLRTWNGGICCGYAVVAGIDDVDFIRQLIAALVARYRIDPARVHATGHSNGAIMSHRLACELSDRIASIMANAGALGVDPCAPGRAVAVLNLHSRLDTQVPYLGGVGTGLSNVNFPPLSETVDRWRAIDGCTGAPDVTVVAGRYRRERWSPCNAGSAVETYLTDDGGHAWPGGEPGRAGSDQPSTAIDANDLALEFFAAHPRQ